MIEDDKTPVADAEDSAEAPAGAEPDAAAGFAALEEELAEAKQAVLYAQAEVLNVRRRAEKEAADARTYAATGFARDILSVSDNLARGLAAIPDDLRSDDKIKGLVAGIEATARELDSVFQRHGISKIVAMDEMLDPNRHQAMFEVPTADVAPGTIVQEIQTGYMIRDRLLRPALVGVAKKPD
ncbi:nucleotide exchange factor GrpE [Hephaestia sp. GCM10023244]|uniref:nucleotide exchange factor GrpE n=1 Tax=unclassified Hephaestia TaxID=2631281 RepID=UPI00207779CC|nr:nucleotide exchange factor GrpE [Hephaestia sp. MAHUQ-44]MCM8729558.1 nucleotide exchange factor GrpE [Hephaestia sp. MAHUQ-44]